MKLYIYYIRAYFKSIMEHKTSMLLAVTGQFLSSFFTFVGVAFLFQRFKEVNGFQYEEILICYANILLAFSLAEFFGRGFDDFDRILSNGQFDRIMVRPRNEIFQVLASQFEFSRLGRLFQAVVIYIYALPRSGITWTMDKIAVQLLSIMCGIILFMALFLMYAALCFFTTQALGIFNILTDGSREFGKYPLSVYGNDILKIFTYIIPIACIQYYPLLYITDKNNSILFGIAPLYSILFIIPSYLLWKVGISKFKSTGS